MSAVVGLRGVAEMVVSTTDTAVAVGSGDVEVLATPRLVALCERATFAAIDGHLDPATTTVGMRVQLDHLQPTPVGSRVEVEALLERVEGRRLTFVVSASDPKGLVAAGRVTRVVVDRASFLAKTT